MKRSRPRSSWDGDDWTSGPWPNQATPISRGETGNDNPTSTLWLPDPESYSGWAMRHVWPEKDTPGEPQRIGFGLVGKE